MHNTPRLQPIHRLRFLESTLLSKGKTQQKNRADFCVRFKFIVYFPSGPACITVSIKEFTIRHCLVSLETDLGQLIQQFGLQVTTLNC